MAMTVAAVPVMAMVTAVMAVMTALIAIETDSWNGHVTDTVSIGLWIADNTVTEFMAAALEPTRTRRGETM